MIQKCKSKSKSRKSKNATKPVFIRVEESMRKKSKVGKSKLVPPTGLEPVTKRL